MGGAIQPVLDELQALLRNGLMFKDNVDCSIITKDLVHGEEETFSVGFKPIGVYALKSEAVDDGERYAVSALDWRIVDDATIGVTARYAAPSGHVVVEKTANMSVAHNARTAMQWSAVKYQEGTAISWSSGANTRLTFSQPGRVQLSTDIILYDTAAGGHRETYWLKNGVTANYLGYDLTPGGVYAGTSGTGDITVASGDYVELYLYQNQTAIAALNVLGGAPNPPQGIVRYVAPPLTATNTVTLLCVGG